MTGTDIMTVPMTIPMIIIRTPATVAAIRVTRIMPMAMMVMRMTATQTMKTVTSLPHQTLAAKASGMANPDPYDRRSSGYPQSSTRRRKNRRSAPRERYDEDYEDYEEPEYQPPRRRKKRHPLPEFSEFFY